MATYCTPLQLSIHQQLRALRVELTCNPLHATVAGAGLLLILLGYSV